MFVRVSTCQFPSNYRGEAGRPRKSPPPRRLDEAAALDAAWAWVKLAPIGASSTSMDEIVARVHAKWPGLAPETIRAEILKRYGEK
jgi:hypothetical protein